MTHYHQDALSAAKNVIARVGKEIVVGTPIGIAKPIGFLNALYTLARNDRSLKLTIVTGLTLTRPQLKSGLEQTFAEPILERVLGDYVDPLYEADRLHNCVPENIKIIEFFLSPAKYLHHDYVQQNYISSSYTDVLRDTLNLSMNVLAQLVTYDQTSECYSLSCSADLFHDALHALKAQNQTHAVVFEVNQQLPLMLGNGLVPVSEITDVIQPAHHHHLFALTRDPLSWQDHMIGLYASTLVKDDGCLQMGIGKLSHAVTHALITRHKDNAHYQSLLQTLGIQQKADAVIARIGDLASFSKGLYASTEMLCDGYADLLHQQLIKKQVYDHIGLQTLLNQGEITEEITAATLPTLTQHNIVSDPLSAADIKFLQHFGILDGNQQLRLGKKLLQGKMIHAGFFVGSNRFYQMLRALPREKLDAIDMTSISRTNSLLGNPALYTLQRQHARFINSCMMVTLGGEVISDTLTDMQELSGVGGQFDFVNMAGKLAGARSIILCRSTKLIKGTLQSNILWEYSNITIPRYLRDIVITEYGIADCRSKTDSDVMKAILNITDSRFQASLLAKAKQARKIEPDYQIPAQFCQNTPGHVRHKMQQESVNKHFVAYPFGSDLTNEELVLRKVLNNLKKLTRPQMLLQIIKTSFKNNAAIYALYLERLNLTKPTDVRNWCYQKLICAELEKMNLPQLRVDRPESNTLST